MTRQEKQRFYIIGAIALAVILLLWFARRGTGAGNTVIQQGGDLNVPGFGASPIDFGDLPPLNYTGSKVASRGCSACFPGYSRITVPTPPVPAPAPETINKYLTLNMSTITRPSPPPQRAGFAFSTSAPEPEPQTFWNTVGRFF